MRIITIFRNTHRKQSNFDLQLQWPNWPICWHCCRARCCYSSSSKIVIYCIKSEHLRHKTVECATSLAFQKNCISRREQDSWESNKAGRAQRTEEWNAIKNIPSKMGNKRKLKNCKLLLWLRFSILYSNVKLLKKMSIIKFQFLPA